MKTLFSFLLFAAVFTLTSFKIQSNNFITTKAPPVSFESSEDITGMLIDGCGEMLQVTEGTNEVSFYGQSNKNVISGSLHGSIHGKAVGLSSGKQYEIISESNASSTGVAANGLLILNNTASVLYIGLGDAVSFRGKMSEKMLVNARGEMITSNYTFKSFCK
ncbi:MAG: hypothetical protein ICV66_09015 [Chitinophagaceae bacterium]|nr:hypothetical protein [Chitinophagaceae bacterium]